MNTPTSPASQPQGALTPAQVEAAWLRSGGTMDAIPRMPFLYTFAAEVERAALAARPATAAAGVPSDEAASLKRLIGAAVNYPGTPRSEAWVKEVFAKIDALAAQTATAAAGVPTPLADAQLLDLADDFKSQYQHGGNTYDEFDHLGYGKAILATLAARLAQTATQPASDAVAWGIRRKGKRTPHMITLVKDVAEGDMKKHSQYAQLTGHENLYELVSLTATPAQPAPAPATQPASETVAPTPGQIAQLALRLCDLDVGEIEAELLSVFSVRHAAHPAPAPGAGDRDKPHT